MPPSSNTRRWQRHHVDIPLRVAVNNAFSSTTVSGLGTELSEGGMELYAGIWVKPGDLVEVEFGIPHPLKMMAVVRHRSGFCFGLEFIAPLQTEPEP